MTTVHVDRRDTGVSVITLDRASRLNAMSLQLIDELHEVVDTELRSPEVRALVFTGTGRAFSSGADVEEFGAILGPGPIDAVKGVERFNAVARQLWRSPVPTIAAVNGPAVGGGASLALLCDIRVMAEGAYILVNQVERRIVPDMGATYLLPRLIGHAAAISRMLFAEPITGDEALDTGLAYAVVEPDQLLSHSVQVAQQCAGGSSVAAGLTAQATRAGATGTLDDALAREAAAQACCSQTAQFDEALSEFLANRTG